MTIKKLSYVLAFSLCLFVTGFLKGSAQQTQPQFLLTWRTESYAPPGFRGKVLPTANSLITVSFELLSGNKLLDLSGQAIYWYLNDNVVAGSQGKQTITFYAPDYAPDVLNVQIQLPKFPGGLLFQSIKIPLVSPEAVIESAYPGGNFAGLSAQVKAVPYFFNVQNPLALNFVWNVNGETPQSAEDPTTLSVNLNSDAAPGSAINIGLTVQTVQNSSDALPVAASANTTLTYVQ
jgi:hypothetical protein